MDKIFKDANPRPELAFDSSKIPLLAWDIAEIGKLHWRAMPFSELYIRSAEQPVIGISYVSTHLFAFTASEKLLLPDPEIRNGVAKLRIYRHGLETAPRIARDPQNDLDDIDHN